MKKILKVYGARGLMEWMVNIPLGKSHITFHFTDGNKTAYGVTPAKYQTENPIYQKAIENSKFFKDGRITLVKTYEREIGSAEKAPKAATPAKTAPATGASVPAGQEQAVIVNVTDRDEAVDYLMETFGARKSDLRSLVAIKEYAKNKNIIFEGLGE